IIVTPFTTELTQLERRLYREFRARFLFFIFRAQDTVPSQRIACLNYTWTRPTWFTHPASRSLFIRGSWFDGILHPNRKFRPIHGPVIGLVLQPVIPPGHDLLQKTNRRPWLSKVWIFVTPRANQAPLWNV